MFAMPGSEFHTTSWTLIRAASENISWPMYGIERTGKASEFDRLSMFLNRDSESVRYERLAEEMGVSAGALRMSVHRFRRRYRRLLRAEIAESVSGPEEIDEELRFLLSIVGN